MEFPAKVSRPIYLVPLSGDLAAAAEGPVVPGTGAVITHYRASLRSAPTGASAILEIYLGNRTTGARAGSPFLTVTIAAAAYKSDGALSEGVRVATTDFLQVVCTQEGSTLPGTDFAIELFGGGGGGPIPGTNGLEDWTEDGSGNLLPDAATQSLGSAAKPANVIWATDGLALQAAPADVEPAAIYGQEGIDMGPGGAVAPDAILYRIDDAGTGYPWLGGIEFRTGTVDPTVAPGVVATMPAMYFRSTGTVYRKTGALATNWALMS